jgi:hypothetical protein
MTGDVEQGGAAGTTARAAAVVSTSDPEAPRVVEDAPGPGVERDLGRLWPLAFWGRLWVRLARPGVIVPGFVVWLVGRTMRHQLEDQLAIMHLPGDPSFDLAALTGAGPGATAVLATWRRWQLAAGPSLVVGPTTVVTHELLLELVLPAVSAVLLGAAAYRTWRTEPPAAYRQIAAVGVVAVPAALVAAHVRAALVAVTAFAGFTPVAGAHLALAVTVAGVTGGLAVREAAGRRHRVPVIVGGAALAGAAAGAVAVRVWAPCTTPDAGCAPDPRPALTTALAATGIAERLIVLGILAAIVLGGIGAVGAWAGSGAPARWFRAVVAVRGQIIAVLPIVLLPLLGTSDLGLQSQNALSRLLESPARSAVFVVGVVAVMVAVAAFAHVAMASAAVPPAPRVSGTASRPAPGAAGRRVGAAGRRWWFVAAAGLALALVLRTTATGTPGLQAALLVLAAVAILSAPDRVAVLRPGGHADGGQGADGPRRDGSDGENRTGQAADGRVGRERPGAANEELSVASGATAAVPAALALLTARLAVTPAGGATEVAAGVLTVVLIALAVAGSLGRRRLVAPLSGRTARLSVVALALVAGLLAGAGAVAPVAFGFALGSMLVLLAAMGVLVVAAGLLVLVGNRLPARGALAAVGFRRLPVLALLLAVAVVAARLDPAPVTHDVRVESVAGAAPGTGVTRRAVGLGEAFARWAAVAPRAPATAPPGSGNVARTPVPLVFVATAGGGIKAAYWTNLVLGCLQEAPTPATPCPRGAAVNRPSLFLGSGVSGGSLGLVVDHARHGGGGPGLDALLDVGLAGDFLAPDIAALVLRDAPNALVHTGRWSDRAVALEDAWSDRFVAAGAPGQGLDAPFLAAAGDDTGAVRFPLLLLNSAAVEDRCRIAVTVLDVAPDGGGRCVASPVASGADAGTVVSRTKEVTDYVCPGQDLRLSTAALLSARFPFVSPYGQLHRCPGDETGDADPAHGLSLAVDGGLVESSAAGPLPGVLAGLAPELDAWEARPENQAFCIAPRLVMIDHGYALETQGGMPALPGQLRAPEAFFSADPAASPAAQQAAVQAFAARQRDHPCGPQTGADITAFFALALHPGQRAPLGWTLSDAARDEMRGQLGAGPTRCGFVTARSWFTPAPADTPAGATAGRAAADAQPDGCLTGTVGTGPADESYARGALVELWRDDEVGGARAAVATTVADATGRFDLAAPAVAGARYSLCYRPGEGAGSVSRLGERFPTTAPTGDARTAVAFAPDHLSRLAATVALARC